MSQPASPATAPDKGVVARAIGILTSPKATSETIAAFPRPAIILILVCLIMGVAAAAPQFTERGRQMAFDMQVRSMERMMPTIPPEMMTRMEEASHTAGATAAIWPFVGVFVAVPLFSLFFTALYWVVFNAIMGGTATFKQVLGIVTHSQVIGALGALVAAPIMYAQGVVTAGGPFHLGALVPFLDPGGIVAQTLGVTSVFLVWSMIVTGIGLGVLYKRNGTTIGIVLIAFYLLLAAGMFTVFSAFTS